MITFILSYIAIYGGAHAYLMTRTVRALHLSAPYPLIFAGLSIFMVAAPILVRILERHGMETPAQVTAHVGYIWMGFFFLFLSASVALDLARWILALAGWLMRQHLWLSEQQLILSAIAIAVAASLYGMTEARRLLVERVTLRSPKIPASVGKVRVVQLSDVHLGLMVGRPRLEVILKQVAALKPDLVVCTGDLVDGQMDGLKGLAPDLAALQAPLGKYAVLGNHEVLAGLSPSEKFTRESGFHLLRGESVAVTAYLTLAGVDDPMLLRGQKASPDAMLLKNLPRDRYTIFLKHRPSLDRDALGLFDLQLSGHVHKGQIFPFNLLTHLVYPLPMGLSRHDNGSNVYVSRGTGTWGPPIRVLAPPEITVIDLVSSE
jgi:uncharacterized protein